MKNIFVALLILAGAAQAQAYGDNSARALLGFTSSAVNIGADFEMKKNSFYGFGGYFFLGSDQDGTGKVTVPEVLALGAFATAHLLNDEQVDVYVGPGFGLAMIDYPGASTVDETTFGPSVKLGVECKVAPTVRVGLQHFIITNWLSDEVASQFNYTNAAVTFAF